MTSLDAPGLLGDAELEILRADPRRQEIASWRRMSFRQKIYFPWRPTDRDAIGALGQKVYVAVGFHADGRAGEIFARGGSKHGEAIDFGLDNVGLGLSVLLQLGEPLERLAELAPAKLAHYLVGADADARKQLIGRTAIAAICHAAIQIEAYVNTEVLAR